MIKVLPSIKSIKVFIFQAGATTGLTEVMSAVVSSGGGNINDLSFQKKQCVDTVIACKSKGRSAYLRKTLKQFMIQKVTDICYPGMEKCCRA